MVTKQAGRGVWAIAMLALSACHHTGAGPSAVSPPGTLYSGQYVLPVAKIDLATIYRSAVPTSNPDDMIDLVPLCENDFLRTPALASLKELASKASVTGKGDETRTIKKEWNSSLEGIDFGFIKIGGSYAPSATASITNKDVTVADIDERDISIVNAKIEKSCRNLIRKYAGQGYRVMFVYRAHFAGKTETKITLDTQAGANVEVKVLNMNPKLGTTYKANDALVIEGKAMYFKVDGVDMGQPGR